MSPQLTEYGFVKLPNTNFGFAVPLKRNVGVNASAATTSSLIIKN